MASAYSITIQVADNSFFPFSPGHVALVLNTPDEQTYSGFGPLKDGSQWIGGFYAYGKYDVQHVASLLRARSLTPIRPRVARTRWAPIRPTSSRR